MSRPWLGKYIRDVVGATFRRIKPISVIHNSVAAKMQRQLAASQFLRNMVGGKIIINLDESVIRYTDHRQRGWVRKASQNLVTSNKRIDAVNLIAASCSNGDFLYTVNIGMTTSLTFGFFLTKLCDHLDSQDDDWR